MSRLSIGKLVIEFFRDMSKVAETGFDTVPVPIYVKRMHACRGCPFLSEFDTCGKCGCYMPVKARFSAMSCPDTPKRWEKEADGREHDSHLTEGGNKEQSVPETGEGRLPIDRSSGGEIDRESGGGAPDVHRDA